MKIRKFGFSNKWKNRMMKMKNNDTQKELKLNKIDKERKRGGNKKQNSIPN